jgi:hypothetical protein
VHLARLPSFFSFFLDLFWFFYSNKEKRHLSASGMGEAAVEEGITLPTALPSSPLGSTSCGTNESWLRLQCLDF